MAVVDCSGIDLIWEIDDVTVFDQTDHKVKKSKGKGSCTGLRVTALREGVTKVTVTLDENDEVSADVTIAAYPPLKVSQTMTILF